MKPPVKVFWWRWRFPHRLNFGDEFSAPLIERLTGRRVEWAPAAECDLVAAGSVVQMVLRRQKENRPMFWGSGYIKAPAASAERVEIEAHALRGRRTRGLIDTSTRDEPVLGDPGLLAPLLIERSVKKRYGLGIIPHYHDANDPVLEKFTALGPGVRIIDVGWSPHEVAREIAACDVVLSSSLHGLIFADAFGVPNLHFKMSDKLRGGTFKFEDYHSAFAADDRYRTYTPPPAGPTSLQDVADAVEQRYVEPEDIEDLQEGLLRALPV